MSLVASTALVVRAQEMAALTQAASAWEQPVVCGAQKQLEFPAYLGTKGPNQYRVPS